MAKGRYRPAPAGHRGGHEEPTMMTMNPKRAVTRTPGRSYVRCLSCHPMRHTIDLSKALEQHARYCETQRELGLEVLTLPPDEGNPDACFVEDAAVVHGDRALMCRTGAESRRSEVPAIEEVLKEHLAVRWAVAPATVEGGDVVHLDDRLLSGISQRTNAEGVEQMSAWLDVRVDTIVDPAIMHLKSYVTHLGGDTVISTSRYSGHSALSDLDVIIVPEGEEYAADTLAIGDAVLMPDGCPQSHRLVREAGFEVIPLDMSEIEKCDGAMTCLSILF